MIISIESASLVNLISSYASTNQMRALLKSQVFVNVRNARKLQLFAKLMSVAKFSPLRVTKKEIDRITRHGGS